MRRIFIFRNRIQRAKQAHTSQAATNKSVSASERYEQHTATTTTTTTKTEKEHTIICIHRNRGSFERSCQLYGRIRGVYFSYLATDSILCLLSRHILFCVCVFAFVETKFEFEFEMAIGHCWPNDTTPSLFTHLYFKL